jgi:hypothetical protein
MTKIVLLISIFLNWGYGHVFSQQTTSLLMIDAENKQPFYVQMGDKSFNSSPSGHLTISEIKDSSYDLIIGSPEKQFPEQKFSIQGNKVDLAFQLKNLGEKGWALYNWQTLETKISLSENPRDTIPSLDKSVKKEDAFSKLMAAVVNDTAVLYNSFAAEELLKDTVKQTKIVPTLGMPKTDSPTLGTVGKKDSALFSVAKTSAPASKTGKPLKNTSFPIHHPSIKKLSVRALTTSLQIRYVDFSRQEKPDTVTLWIAYEKEPKAGLKPGNTPTQTKTTKKETNVQPADSLRKMDSAATPDLGLEEKNTKKKTEMEFADCKTRASDYDLDVLRVNILTANTENDKIGAARKTFKTMCFSVKQIKALSELFASDKSRYRFYETAYPYVSDRDRFNQLLETLTEAKYIDQFKTLTGQ